MTGAPRVVLVTRPTDYQLLLARHGTRGQAAFFLSSRGQCIEKPAALHQRFVDALKCVQAAVPAHWRCTQLTRGDLDRFVFEPGDIITALGQDGLVANLAKYLSGQTVIGLNPTPEAVDGVLVRHAPSDAAELLHAAAGGTCHTQARTMVEARLDDGQTLRSLNEVFVAHASHQSARYSITFGGRTERQSSSGAIVATGSGATGWARSIHRSSNSTLKLPDPEARQLAYFVREPWPSVATGTTVVEGLVDETQPLVIASEMDEHGVIFGDGIEADHLTFGYGQRVEVGLAAEPLNLVSCPTDSFNFSAPQKGRG
jgi:NAD kinase